MKDIWGGDRERLPGGERGNFFLKQVNIKKL